MTDTNGFPLPVDTADPIPEAECRRLLATRTLGRVGMTSGGLPVILLVHFTYADDAITFEIGSGRQLRSAESGDVLAFEVDAYDGESGGGWSVLVLGRATVSKKAGVDDHCVRLPCEIVSGRRLGVVPGVGVVAGGRSVQGSAPRH